VSACRRCLARVENLAVRGISWKGDAPRCAFETGAFSADNYLCATALAIRDLVLTGNEPTAGVAAAWSGDQKAMLVPIDLDEEHGHFLLVSSYKHRGATDVLALVGDGDLGVVALPLSAVDAVIAYLERTLAGVVATPAELRS
jgi:hypothetical protein